MSELIAWTRREFLHRGIGLVGLPFTAPQFLSQTIAQLEEHSLAPGAGGKDGKILVVVQLAGGNDGLNTIIPYRNDEYYRIRPSIAIKPDDVLRINDDYAFHPGASGLKSIFDEGQLAVVQGVGYPNPNRSHFVGTRVWHSASPDGKLADGWLGRYFDHECEGCDIDPRQAVALTGEMPLALRGEKFMPLCLSNDARLPGANRHDNSDFIARDDQPADSPETQLDFLRRAALDAQVHAREISKATRREIEGAKFPGNAFARSLQSIARMIAAGMPTKVYYTSLSGFDTHANQPGRHAQLLRAAGDAFAAFLDALRRTSNLPRVLILTFSEFGRRATENASSGTDHGEAAPMFVMGGPVRGGLVGEMPALDKLHRGDLAYHTDFRAVYATVLKDWFGVDPEPMLGGEFKPIQLIRNVS